MENLCVEKVATAESLMIELKSGLVELERLGALIAAAHLDACINVLARDFRFQPDQSDPD